MRYDEINLTGQLTINGLTANVNQYLGASGGSLYWLDTVITSTGFDIYGKNYVFCNSYTFSATASGENLLFCYASASEFNLTGNERAAILIMPGVYDFDDKSLHITASNIDFVGINSSSDSVQIKSTNSDKTFIYGEGVNSGFYNLTLMDAPSGGLSTCGTPSFLSWKNLKVGQRAFFNPTVNSYSFQNLYGEFRDIEIVDGGGFANVTGGIEGTFDNITSIGNAESSFFSQTYLSGTFSNIKLRSNGVPFFSAQSGDITGTFKNIEINELDNCFVGYNISGSFENIKVGLIYSDFFFGTMSGIFKNIEFGYSANYAFRNTAGTIDGVFQNILGEANLNCFFDDQPEARISGTFSDIKIKSPQTFYTGGQLIGNFNNIELTTINGFVGTTLSGTFSDIKIIPQDLTVGFLFFYAYDTLNADITRLEIYDAPNAVAHNTLSSGVNVVGNYRDIKIGTTNTYGTIFAGQSINGNFENITIKDATILFQSRNILGNYSEIKCDSALNSFFLVGKDSDGINGNFSDIYLVIRESGSCFSNSNYLSSFLIGNFKNIEIKGIPDSCFRVGAEITGNFENIYIDSTNIACFTTIRYNFSANFKNITIGKSPYVMFVCEAASMDLVVDNLLVKDSKNGVSTCFSSSSISGTYSNIQLLVPLAQRSDDSSVYDTFYGSSWTVNLENIYVFGAVGIFTGPQQNWHTSDPNCKIKNLNIDCSFGNSFFIYNGTLTDSIIESRTGFPPIKVNLDTRIERCRITIRGYLDYCIWSSDPSVAGFSGYYGAFLTMNKPVDPQLTNSWDDTYNIVSDYVNIKNGKIIY